jgi:hypothetical protein
MWVKMPVLNTGQRGHHYSPKLHPYCDISSGLEFWSCGQRLAGEPSLAPRGSERLGGGAYHWGRGDASAIVHIFPNFLGAKTLSFRGCVVQCA